MIQAKFILNNYINEKLIKTGRKAGNATYFYKNGNQYLVTRESNYVYGRFPDNSIRMYIENGAPGFNIDEALYENGNFIKLLTNCNRSLMNDVGFEDPRCIKWNDKQYIMFNRRNLENPNLVQMHIGEIDDDFNYVNDKVLPNLMQVEKNWQPIEAMPGECIYSYKPFKTINVFTNEFKEIQNDVSINFRGSSQIIKYKEYNLGLVHIRNEAFEYLNYLILFDKDLKILKISEPFSFFGANVEFVAHIEYNNVLKILVSVHDQILYEFSLTDELVNHILEKKLNNNQKNSQIFTKLYNDAILNGNIFGALGIATFSKEQNLLCDAIQRNQEKNYFNNLQNVIHICLLNNLKKQTNYNVFKDFNYINALIFNTLYKIPKDIDIIVGIPRSGMLIGSLLGEYLNKPCIDIYSFNKKIQNVNLNTASRTPIIDYAKIKKVLLVDDTVFQGTTLHNAINFIKKDDYEIITYCVFIQPGMSKNCDIYCEEIEHFIPWNIIKVSSPEACFDMDGVLCEEVPHEVDDDGIKYQNFIKNSRQLFIPTQKINTIVTGRLEKYRSITEEWLRKHNIKYDRLVMLNVPNNIERSKINVGAYKADVYNKLGLPLFIESSIDEAVIIKRLTNKPVFCTSICNLI